MNIKNFKEIMPYLIKAKIATMLWSEAGVGKTSICKQLANSLGYNFIYLTLASCEDNSDLIGLLSPIKDDLGNDVAVRHLRPEWFPTTPKNIILIDEASRMPKSIVQSMLTFILDHKLHTHYLPEDTHFILASNPPSDDYITGDFTDKALVSRICHICLEPTVDEFLEFGAKTGMHDEVLSFIQENPEMLEAKAPSFLPEIKPNRRAYKDFISPFLKTNPPKDLVFEVVRGLVGAPAAVKLQNHLKNSTFKLKGKDILNKYDAVMRSKVKANINELDLINIAGEELAREISIATKITKKQGKNVIDFLMDIPVELSWNLSRVILGLGLETVNNTVGEDKELLHRVRNKSGELEKKEEVSGQA